MEDQKQENQVKTKKEMWQYYLERIFYYSLAGLVGVVVWRFFKIAFSSKPLSFLYDNLESAILCVISFAVAGWIQAYLARKEITQSETRR